MTTGKLGVTVSVDLDASTVTIRPVGTLTNRNIEGLLALRRRAERALPYCEIVLDGAFLGYESADAREALIRSELHPETDRPRRAGPGPRRSRRHKPPPHKRLRPERPTEASSRP